MKVVYGIIIGIAIGIGIMFSSSLAKKSETPVPPSQALTPTCGMQDEPSGRVIKIGFSAPGADHGWLAAITTNAKTAAKEFSDVELFLTDGLNTSEKQASDVEDLLQKKVDVMVMLPQNGGELEKAARKVRQAGVPLINLDRKIPNGEFYCYLGGDNYGIGVAAARYIGTRLNGKGNVIEIAGIAGISVTTDRSAGFANTLKEEFPGIKILATQPADFLAEKGLNVTQNLLQAHKKIDAIYSHDDDMNVGVLQAVKEAGREKELFITGAGGSKWAFEKIKSGTSAVQATFLYNPSMAGSGIRLARLAALQKGMSDLWEREIPREIKLSATTITKENVDRFMPLGF